MNLKLLGACSALSLLMFADVDALRAGRQFDKARAMGLGSIEEYNAVKKDAHAMKDGKVKVADYVASFRGNLEEGQTLREALAKAHEERMAAQKEEARPEVVDGIPEVVAGTPAASDGTPVVDGGKFLRSPSPASEGDIDGEPSIEDGEGAGEAGAGASAVEDGEGAGAEGPKVTARFLGFGKKVEGLSFDLDEFKEEINQKSFAELDNMLKEQNAVVASARGKLLHKMTSEEKIAENDANAKIKELSEAINRFATVSVDALDKDGLLFEKDRLEAKEKPSREEGTRLEQINNRLDQIKLDEEDGL